jgi:NAD(P)-dependent dehydrogenase (short-subunit alcohol dehydrogenase family)
VDILVNNAAACFYLPVDRVSDRRYAVMLEVNVHAPWDLIRAVLPAMRARGAGWILNISSRVAEHPPRPPYPAFHVEHGATLYGLSKAALALCTGDLTGRVTTSGAILAELGIETYR